MADFYSILSKGINALDRNMPEARWRLYERAIAALIAEMRGSDPALNPSEFQVAWRSLKEAIVKIEIEIEIEIEAEAETEGQAEIEAETEAEAEAEAEAEPEAEAEAEAEVEAEAEAEAEVQRDRLIHRPIATTSTSLRRTGIAASPVGPAVRLGGPRRPRLMGFLTRALRRDPDAAARDERKRPADRGDPSSDFWSEMQSGQPRDNWLSDVLVRASRDDHATLKKRR
jgi:hypothetical protein